MIMAEKTIEELMEEAEIESLLDEVHETDHGGIKLPSFTKVKSPSFTVGDLTKRRHSLIDRYVEKDKIRAEEDAAVFASMDAVSMGTKVGP
jgi:hypothetical protein